MVATWKKIYERRELLWTLSLRNLKIRYKGSVLGFLWSLLVPLSLIVIYAIFLRLMRFEVDLPALVTGIFVWQFLSMCSGDSLFAIIGNANLVTKASFPRLILPLSTVAANFVNFLLSGVVLCGYLLFIHQPCGDLLWVPVAVASQLALCTGITLLFATANVFFRDTQHILSMVMLAWFFVTPVIYQVEMVTGVGSKLPYWTSIIFFLNPMTGILTTYRVALLGHAVPEGALLLLSHGVAWLIFVAGLMIFNRVEGRISDEL